MDIFDFIRSNNLKEIREWVENKNANKDVLRHGVTPLHYAICLENEEAAEIFVKNDLYIQSVNWNNNTPLHYAAVYGLVNLASSLIERGAIVNTKNKFGRTPLHIAAWYGSNHIVLVFIEKGAKINVFDEDGETPLRNAIWSFKTIKTLLNEGASLFTHDNDGNYYLKFGTGENVILFLKQHVKLQKFIVCSKKLFLTSRVFLKFLNTFKISFNK